MKDQKIDGSFLEIYPRPQMRRTDWLSLNGIWSLKTEGDGEKDILVPFCPESRQSGWEGRIGYGRRMRYKRNFTVPEEWAGKRILLHFGAVSNRCEVFVNNKKVCEHENGYTAFTADITDALDFGAGADNLLEVDVVNDLGGRLPTGKQKIERGGMWYTPVSGIWQSVWIEPVPADHIKKLTITPDMNGADIVFEGVSEGTVTCERREYSFSDGKVRIEPDVKRLWSPESPYLYDFCIKCGDDTVRSYFALRTVSVKTSRGVPRLCLNDRPYFFHGLLDQGYFAEGIYTPASLKAYENDILAMKGLGFNMLRKHIKIEPEQFYYDCDRLGMVVFQDMVNNGKYSFFRDTLLPTIGLKRRSDRRLHKDPAARSAFLQAMEQTVAQLSNHPCICYWTIFNEGWGQFEADKAYERLKQLDDSRITDSASGWFGQRKSDVDSRHIYFRNLKWKKKGGLPMVLSEFGGYVYKIPEHSYNLEKTYGYGIMSDRKAYADALRRLYSEEVLPLVNEGLSAAVYTQVSDVEDETNGLLTYDRQVQKISPEEFFDISAKITAQNR